MDTSIRRRDDLEPDAAYDAYHAAYAEIEARLRAEYEAEFGSAFRQQYPFRPNGQLIHEMTLQQIGAANQN